MMAQRLSQSPSSHFGPRSTNSDRAKITVGFFQVMKGWHAQAIESWSKESQLYSNTMKVLLGFLQVLISLLSADITWPVDFAKVIGWFSFLTFSLEMPATACVTQHFKFIDRLLFYAFAPFALMILISLPSLWAKCRHHPALHELIERAFHWSVHYGIVDVACTCSQCHCRSLWFTYLCFPSVSKVVISALVCDNLKDDGMHLSVDYRVDCLSGEWKGSVRIIGWAALL